ncbi:MAG: efflux RND transporter permease subunit, partial [Saprospiraceae bacterium]|nr:efflux RND transporter permease subunit [Saprospiraceae bacterium]
DRGLYRELYAFVGEQSFLLPIRNMNKESAHLIIYSEPAKRQLIETRLKSWILERYPDSQLTVRPMSNLLDHLFPAEIAGEIIRVESTGDRSRLRIDRWDAILEWLKQRGIEGMEPQWETLFELTPVYSAIHRYGLDQNQLVGRLTFLLSGLTAGEIPHAAERQAIRLRNAEESGLQKLLSGNRVQNKKGDWLPLDKFVYLQKKRERKFIRGGRRGERLQLETRRLKASERSDLRRYVADTHPGMLLEFTGEEARDLSFHQLALSTVLTLLLLYLILAVQFESLSQPFIVLSVVPFSLSGAFLVLFLGGQSLNVMAGIGMIVSCGIVVNDAVLKVDATNRFRKSLSLGRAISTAGRIRLRPIMMTSLTTILALIPVMLSSGLGADLQRPLAQAVIGGLLFGTAASIFVLPGLYYWGFQQKKPNRSK